MGLHEPVPERPRDTRWTALGKEVNAELMLLFMGGWYEWEVPEMLQIHGLMSRDEMIELHEQYFEDGEQFVAVLLPYVQRAFREYFKADTVS